MTGCGHTSAFIATNTTEVQLQEGNYHIIAMNVTGSAETEYVLGGSFSWGVVTKSFRLIPLEGSKTLCKDAREELWTTLEEQYTSVEGKKLALINIPYDTATYNYLIYTKANITMTADVIEFE